MSPFSLYFDLFECSTLQELYSQVEIIAIIKMGLEGPPFTLSTLEQPWSYFNKDFHLFFIKCYEIFTKADIDEEIVKLVEFLRKNPPQPSYENPIVETGFTKAEMTTIQRIFYHGLELPGSRNNPLGMGYFTGFFLHVYFGNMTGVMEYINSLSKDQLDEALKMREGYRQFSPVFAPILGRKLVRLNSIPFMTKSITQEIRNTYPGNIENKHVEILEKLLELGADPNAHDIFGNTPLVHTLSPFIVKDDREQFATALLKHGANPNTKCRLDITPLSMCSSQIEDDKDLCVIIDLMIKHNVKPCSKEEATLARSEAESNGPVDFAVRVREAFPRGEKECEKCEKSAEKKCTACYLVHYCSPACQKLDWKFHKVTCKRNRQV
jgi:hypothetical protein